MAAHPTAASAGRGGWGPGCGREQWPHHPVAARKWPSLAQRGQICIAAAR
ncbi:hypothetical protein ACFQV8_39980 [Pseudonocardia benzenivorans]